MRHALLRGRAAPMNARQFPTRRRESTQTLAVDRGGPCFTSSRRTDRCLRTSRLTSALESSCPLSYSQDNTMLKLTLNQKLLSMIAVLWIGLVFIGVVGAWQYRTQTISNRRQQLMFVTDEAMSIVDAYYA